mgnify:CR=1 FL=1
MIKKFKVKNFYKLFICYIGYPILGVYSLNSFAIENNLKIIIPAEKNGGIDYIARKIGEFLNDEKIIKKIQYENISGIGASKGIEEFLKMNTNENSFLIASLGAHVNDLQGNLSQDKDLLKKLTPLAIISEDYPIIAVSRNSSLKNEEELMPALRQTSEYLSSFENNNALPNHGFESITNEIKFLNPKRKLWGKQKSETQIGRAHV